MAVSPSLNSLSKVPKSSSPKPQIFNLLTTTPKTHFKFTPIFKQSTLSLFTAGHANQKPTIKHHSNSSTRCLFTGIVEEMGEVKQLGVADHGGFDLKIHANTVLDGVKLGDSIAVNGACMTVTDFDKRLNEFTIGLSPETLRTTALVELEPGWKVNLERALRSVDRVGGHFMQGHVDGTGEIVGMEMEGDGLWVKIKTEKSLLQFIVPKGSIAIDGTSLTVLNVFDDESCFNIMLVGYTQKHVVLPLKKVGQKVNLEVDVLGKYVERLLGAYKTS